MINIIVLSVYYNFTQALLILVQGMAGIFVFMGLFYALVFALERIFKEKKQP